MGRNAAHPSALAIAMKDTHFFLAAGALEVGSLVGCSGEPAPAPSPSGEPASAAPPTIAASATASRPVTMADLRGCQVTRPGRFSPPPGETYQALFGADSSHRNGQLWVGGLGANGVIAADPSYVERDGSVGMKFGWYRVAPG